MPRRRSRVWHATLTALLLCTPTVAQNRDTLETKITADGDVVLFDWDKKHPWDAQLRARGAALVAEYRTERRGLVSEILDTDAPRIGKERLLRFRLPEMLTTAPIGAVCLFLQLPTRQIVPIRKANRRSDDTSRFRYEAWEHAAVTRQRLDMARRDIGQKEQALAVATAQVTAQQATVAKRRQRERAECLAIAAPETNGATAPPFDVIPMDQQDAIARRVCVSRVAWGEHELQSLAARARSGDKDGFHQYLGRATQTMRAPAIVEGQLAEWRRASNEGDAMLTTRTRQAADFRADWAQFAAEAHTYTTPHFGAHGDVIALPSEAQGPATRVLLPLLSRELSLPLKADAPAAEDHAGYVGGSFEAYARCVEDGRKQLNTKFDSWQALRRAAPGRSAAIREQLVAACTGEFDELDRREAERRALADSLVRDKELLTSVFVPPLLRNAQQLNFVACGLTSSHIQ